jgi:hypothetical protein
MLPLRRTWRHSSLVPALRRLAILLGFAHLIGAPARNSAQAIQIQPATPPAAVRDVSIEQYREHLNELESVVAACAKDRNEKACDPALVGDDDRVPLGKGANTEQRRIRFDWLRTLIARAQRKDDDAPKEDPTSAILPGIKLDIPPRRTVTQLLQDAAMRLQQDFEQAGGEPQPVAAHPGERDELGKVLAGREFRNLGLPSITDTVSERILNWIARFFDRIARFSARSPWIGLLVKWGFFGAVCVGLAWGLIQLERRWRIRLVPESHGPAPDAASARDWQLWLEDARRAAAEGRWREAIHFVYWASISRLESRRLWPADRARTPREYLALVAEEDPRKQGLASLTRSFERIWYGGRNAGESDYRDAEQLATSLIGGGGAA